jgi:hypothetical protein
MVQKRFGEQFRIALAALVNYDTKRFHPRTHPFLKKGLGAENDL